MEQAKNIRILQINRTSHRSIALNRNKLKAASYTSFILTNIVFALYLEYQNKLTVNIFKNCKKKYSIKNSSFLHVYFFISQDCKFSFNFNDSFLH